MNPRFLALLVALPAVLAGCTDEAAGTAFHATGSKAFFSLGWAHDGNVTAGEGEVTIDVDEATNAGRVEATVRAGGVTWSILWTNFSEAAGRPFQSGGIARDLTEHGDTNVGDSLIPRVHLVSAGWGRAELRQDGVPLLDPATGGLWTAHYMATDTGVRAADGTIKTRAGGVYDPTRPGEGAWEEGDREVWIVLRPGGEIPADLNQSATEAVNTPQYSKEFPFTVAAPGGPIRVTFASAGPPTPVPLPAPTYDLTFTLLDTAGTQLQTAKNAGELTAPGAPGDYLVQVTGAAVQSTYDLTIAVDYPANEPFVFLFEEASW